MAKHFPEDFDAKLNPPPEPAQIAEFSALDTGDTAEEKPDTNRLSLPPTQLTLMGLGLELLLVLLALFFGWLGFYFRAQPLSEIWNLDILSLLIWSIAGLAGLAGLFLSIDRIPFAPVRQFRDFVQQNIAPLFRELSLFQIAAISLSAGIGEELFFRWCLQGGLQSWIATASGPWIALLLISILFGVCHAVTVWYAIFATIAGLILGIQLLGSGSVLPGIIAHSVFDFAALIYYSRMNFFPKV